MHQVNTDLIAHYDENPFLIHRPMTNCIYVPGCPQHSCLQGELTVKAKKYSSFKE